MDDLAKQWTTDTEKSKNIPADKPKGKPKTFQCPACGGSITIKAVGSSISAICSQCSSIIDVVDENYQIISKSNTDSRSLFIEIGSKGKIGNIVWEVIGYVQKTDETKQYKWEEYLLYNPYHGFRFLVHAAGHWNLVKVLQEDIPGIGHANTVYFEGKKYPVFLKGESIVQYVKGEFYWRIKVGDNNKVADYICPPFMISSEMNEEEINVSLCKYIEPSEIAAAFNIKKAMPKKQGVAPNQPSRYQDTLGLIWKTAIAAILMAFLVQSITSAMMDDANVYESQAFIYPEQKGLPLITPSLHLPKEGNLLIQSSSPVQNNWVELELSLVNEQTDQEYSSVQGIEYYFGYDSDGSWTEGSQESETFISHIPAGNYRLLVETDAGSFKDKVPINLTMRVKRDVPTWSNFWITISLILVYPLFVGLRRRNFELKRWSESDYAPYIYKDDDD